MRAPLETLPPSLIPLLLLVLSVGLGRLLAGRFPVKPANHLLTRLAVYSLCGCIAFSWAGTILAVLGVFRWWVLLILAAVAFAFALSRGQSAGVHEEDPTGGQRTPRLVHIVFGCMLIGIGWLFARPAESFFVFNDAAVYTIGGVLLSRTGSLSYNPGAFWTVSDEFLRQFFFTDRFGTLTRHYGPFYQWPPWIQTLEIGFLPLPKVWMALTTWMGGPQNASWVMPFLGIVSSALLYCLAEQLLGWSVGLGAVALLSASLPQIWFARYPTSEIPSQLFIVGGLYLLVLARKHASRPVWARRLAFWSGLAFAVLTILRLEAVLLLTVFAGLLVIGWYRQSSGLPGYGRTWLLSLVGAGGIGLALSFASARYYLFTRLLDMNPAVTRVALLLLLVGAALGGLGWWYRRQPPVVHARAAVSQAIRRYFVPAIAGGWLLWGAIAAWHLIGRGVGSSLNGWLAQYWTLPGLALSLLGALWLLWQGRQGASSPEIPALLGLSAVLLLVFSIRSYVFPIQPWAVRRLVPAVMPAVALSMAGLVTVAAGVPDHGLSTVARRSIKWGATGLALIAILSLAAFVGQRSLPILYHRERAGLWHQLATLAETLPEDAVLLFDNGDVTQGLTQATELLFGRTSLVIQHTPPSDGESEVDRVIHTALDAGRPAYLIITNGDLAWWPEQWRFIEADTFEIEVPVLRQPEGRRPTTKDVVTQTLLLDAYQIKRSADLDAASPSAVSEVPITAGGSYPYLRRGFYTWHRDAAGRPTRWTDGQSMIVTPWPDLDTGIPVDFCLRLDIAGGRPDSEEPAHLTVVAEGEELFSDQLPTSFSPQSLLLPAASIVNHGLPELEIRLDSTTWDASSVGDPRTLGVLFYGMELMPPDQCASD